MFGVQLTWHLAPLLQVATSILLVSHLKYFFDILLFFYYSYYISSLISTLTTVRSWSLMLDTLIDLWTSSVLLLWLWLSFRLLLCLTPFSPYFIMYQLFKVFFPQWSVFLSWSDASRQSWTLPCNSSLCATNKLSTCCSCCSPVVVSPSPARPVPCRLG